MNETGKSIQSNLKELWGSLRTGMKSQKPASFLFLLILAGVGVILVVLGNGSAPFTTRQMAPTSTPVPVTGGAAESVESRMEQDLERTLEGIAGVGAVTVDLDLKSKNRMVWERQTQTSKRVTQEQAGVNTEESVEDQLVFAKGSDGLDSPVLKEELAPEILGVVVVAEGAEDSRVKQLLTETIKTVLGIPAHRVLVVPGEHGGS